MKLMPGVRLNFNKDSIGMSFGVPGARYTINSKGRRTISTGIPGTGIYDVTTLSGGRSSRRAAQEEVAQVEYKKPAPGLFASKGERELSRFISEVFDVNGGVGKAGDIVFSAQTIKGDYPKLAPALDLIAVLHGLRDESTSEAATVLAKELWANRFAIFNNKLVNKYLSDIHPSVQVTPGIYAGGPYTVQTLGFMLSEILQREGKYQDAVAVLHLMAPTQLVGISIADIELSAGDYDGAIETTDDIENIDDATAMMLVLRGIAFREKGLDDGALECFKRAIAKKDRSEGVIHRALFERAMTYKKLGKKAAAKKDLEKILVDDPSAAGVNEALAAL